MKLMGNVWISITRPQKHDDKSSGNTPRQPAVELIDPAHTVSVFWFPCDHVLLVLGLTTFSNSLQLLTSADTARKLVMERQINIFLLIQLLLSRQTHHYTRNRSVGLKSMHPPPPPPQIRSISILLINGLGVFFFRQRQLYCHDPIYWNEPYWLKYAEIREISISPLG